MRCRLLVLALVAFCSVVRAEFCEYCQTNVVSDASPSQISDQLDAWDSSVQDLYGDLSDLSIEMDLLYQDLSDLDALFDAGLAAAMSAAGYGARYNNMYSLLEDCFDQYDRITDQYNWLGTHVGDLEMSLQNSRRNIHYVTVSTNCTAQAHVGGGDGCGCVCHCQDYSADIADILSTLQAIEGNTYDCGSWLIDILTTLQELVGDVRLSDFLPLYHDYNSLTNAPYGGIDVPTDDFTRADLDSLNLWQRLNLYLYRELDPGESPGSFDGDAAINDNVESLESYTNTVASLAAATTNSISALGPLADSVFNTLGAGTANAESLWRPNEEAHCPRRIVFWSGLDLLGVHVPGVGIDIGSSGASPRDRNDGVRTWSSESLDDIVEYSRKVSIALWFVLISFPTVSIIVRNTGRIVKGVGIVIAFVHSLLK